MKAACVVLCVFFLNVVNGLTLSSSTPNSNFDYLSISGMLRSNFTASDMLADLAVSGDLDGRLCTWKHDPKKDTLTYLSINRPVQAFITQKNPILQLKILANGLISLTQDGKIKSSKLNASGIFVVQTVLEVPDNAAEFQVINVTHFLAITNKTVCLYSSKNLIQTPNPISKMACNTSNNQYLDVAYGSNRSLVATGSNKSVIIFQATPSELKFACEINLPKTQENNLALIWTDEGTLIADNGLWISTIVFDGDSPVGKLLSALRVQQIVSKGQSDSLSIFQVAKSEPVLLTNAKNQGQVYTISTQGKIQFKNSTKELGMLNNFKLFSINKFVYSSGVFFNVAEFSTPSSTEQYFFRQLTTQSMGSNNHFQAVCQIAFDGQLAISVSQGGIQNFKIWSWNSKNLELVDQKTFGFSTLLKSGYTNLKTIVTLPPKQSNLNQTKTQTLHLLTAGSEPFSLILVILAANTNKISEFIKTNDTHSANITFMTLSLNRDYVITGSKDTFLNVWTIDSERRNISKSASVVTKQGPISFGIMDSSRNYIALGHDATFINPLANISIWKFEEKGGKLTKLAQNVPGQAHEANLTSFLISKDQQFFITQSEKGELKLWRHENWTMVDLLASLSLGYVGAMTISEKNRLVIETNQEFNVYEFDSIGFRFSSKTTKKYSSSPNIVRQKQGILFSGDRDGAIRFYNYQDA